MDVFARYEKLTIPQLRQLALQRGVTIRGLRLKQDLIDALKADDVLTYRPPQVPQVNPSPPSPKYFPEPAFESPKITKPTPHFYINKEKEHQPAASVSIKIRGATYPVYDFVWREGYYRLEDNTLEDPNYLYQDQWVREPLSLVSKSFTEFLMEQPPNYIARLAQELGFDRLNETIDIYYNLFWYLNIAQDSNAMKLTKEEKSYISGLTTAELQTLLGKLYRGPTDKASLLFAAVSGKSAAPPDLRDIPRYQTVAQWPPTSVWRLANGLYNLIDTENQIYSLYPPYVHVAFQRASDLEAIVLTVNNTNVDTLARNYGIVARIPQELVDTPIEKLNRFIKEIQNYEPVFTRKPNIPPPPALTRKTLNQIKNILSPYTLAEIEDAYEPIGTFGGRVELTNLVTEELRGGSKWAWRHKYCNNDDTMNVLELEPHSDINKDNPNDPTLSYGVPRNYRCYQMEELAATWRDYDDNFFHFQVPDWDTDRIDLTTGQKIIKDFPLESIRQLRDLLNHTPPNYNIKELQDKIRQGLDAAGNAAALLRKLKTDYDAMPENNKQLIKLYLAWLFTYGMWIRFWKGPGHPWPTEWTEGGGRKELCDIGHRDAHVFLQQSILNTITDGYTQVPGLKAWIEALPLVDYNFTSGEAKLATQGATTIREIMNEMQKGKFCLPHGSDLILKTSYYLIARILNLNTIDEFNAFINEMMPIILDIEGQQIRYQLANMKQAPGAEAGEINQQKKVLQERQRELINPPPQPPFRPHLVTGTHHTDPVLGYRIKFGDE